MKDFYSELNNAIEEYEFMLPYKRHHYSWISDKISWCWKFKKITKSQMEELCDRMTSLFNNGMV